MTRIFRSFVITTAVFVLICILSFAASATKQESEITTANILAENAATPILADMSYTDISPCITKDNVVFTYNRNTFS